MPSDETITGVLAVAGLAIAGYAAVQVAHSLENTSQNVEDATGNFEGALPGPDTFEPSTDPSDPVGYVTGAVEGALNVAL